MDEWVMCFPHVPLRPWLLSDALHADGFNTEVGVGKIGAVEALGLVEEGAGDEILGALGALRVLHGDALGHGEIVGEVMLAKLLVNGVRDGLDVLAACLCHGFSPWVIVEDGVLFVLEPLRFSMIITVALELAAVNSPVD